MLSLNEALKAAGLPQQLNEASSVPRLRIVSDKIHDFQKVFSNDSAFAKALEADGADMSYFKDASKLLDQLEDALAELHKSVEIK